MTSPSVRDHFRPTNAPQTDGIYRVVGVTEDSVTLLRVGDPDGRRVSTGELVSVDDDLEGFEPAANPDGNRPLGAAVASRLVMIYWSVRAFGQQLAARPFPSATAAALVLAGYAGEGIVPLPNIALSALVLGGGFGLAYVGSGRSRR